MACSPTPTETRYATVVNSLSSALLSDSVSSLPALTVTLTSLSCSPTEAVANATGCVDVPVPFVTTIDGGQITVQVPVFTLISVTHVIPTETLFEPCSSPSPPAPPSAIPPQSDPPPAPSAPSAPSPHSIRLPDLSSSSLSPTLSSALSIAQISPPSPSLSSSSLPSTPTAPSRGSSGLTTTTTFTSTSTGIPFLNPTGMSDPSDSDNTTTQQDATPTTHSGSIVGPIVGGILGGFFGLIGIALLIWYLWRKRRQVLGIRSRSPSPPPEIPEMAYKRSSKKRDSRAPYPISLDPKPYQYGTVGSLRTHGRSGSYPGTSRHSSLHSHDHSPTTPRTISYAGSGSVRLSMGGLPTPPIVPSTALNPGSSQPSSRPSTPGYFGYSPPPSAYPYNTRQSWPIYNGGGEDDGQSSGFGSPPPSAPTSESHAFAGASPSPRRERRPSRLSLTFSNCEAAASGSEGERSGAASTRSVSMNLSTNMHGDHTRSPSASGDERDERRKSVLFVVNGDARGLDAADSGAPT